MKNKARRIVALLCALVSVFSLVSFTACKDDGPKIDHTKTQLHICNFNGGVGSQWLDEAVIRFTERYKDHSFEPGKTGVQVWIEKSISISVDSFPTSDNDIYFMEQGNYYNMLSTGNLLDITDMVTKPMTEFGETASVEDKLYDNYKDYFKTPAGTYFGIPHYKGIYGITYDRNLWNEKGLFFSADGNVGKKESDTNLSYGPDGKTGVIDGVDYSYDDGLPATYAQFDKLCSAILKRGITPIAWSGAYQWYAEGVLAALKADFEGKYAHLPYSYNGTTYDKLIKSINADGTVTYEEPTEIGPENGWKMYASAGNYYPLKFIETIINKNYYATDSFNSATLHTDIQGTYLLSKYTDKRIAMLMEGYWWPYEASSYVQRMQSSYGESLDSRNFAIMPYPKATEAQIGEKQTVLDTACSISCINAHIEPSKIELAKLFLQFLETDEELLNFLKCTNITRSFKYDVPEKVYSELNTFAKSVVSVIMNGDHVTPASKEEIYYNNKSTFDQFKWFRTSQYSVCTTAMKDKGISAKQIFDAIKGSYTQDSWNLLITFN